MSPTPKRTADESAERIAALEAQVENLWQQLRRVEEGVVEIPTQITAALARHEDTCVGRSYVLSKIRSKQSGAIPLPTRGASDAPPRVRDEREVTQVMRRRYAETPATDELSKLIPPWKLAVYVGIILGAAIVAAVMIAGKLGLFDLLSAAGK